MARSQDGSVKRFQLNEVLLYHVFLQLLLTQEMLRRSSKDYPIFLISLFFPIVIARVLKLSLLRVHHSPK
jgi:hypothetical protein